MLALASGEAVVGVPETYLPAMRWAVTQLDAEARAFMAQWPATLSLEIDRLGRVLFCHATPQIDTPIFTRLTAEEHLTPLFHAIDADVVVCGHTHMPFDRMVGSVRVVNAGSVGMPFGAAGADWLLLGPDLHLQHTTYDLSSAAGRIRATAILCGGVRCPLGAAAARRAGDARSLQGRRVAVVPADSRSRGPICGTIRSAGFRRPTLHGSPACLSI